MLCAMITGGRPRSPATRPISVATSVRCRRTASRSGSESDPLCPNQFRHAEYQPLAAVQGAMFSQAQLPWVAPCTYSSGGRRSDRVPYASTRTPETRRSYSRSSCSA